MVTLSVNCKINYNNIVLDLRLDRWTRQEISKNEETNDKQKIIEILLEITVNKLIND